MVAANAAGKDFRKLAKDRKDIRKNEEVLGNLRLAQVEKSEIKKMTALIAAQRQLELMNLTEDEKEKVVNQYNEALADAIDRAMKSVLDGRNIEGAVKAYMRKHGITKLQVSDIEQLLKEFNLDNIELQITRLSDVQQIDKLERELKELKEQLKSAAEGVALTDEEKNQIDKDIKAKEKAVESFKKKRDVIVEVGKKASKCQGLDKYMLYKDLLSRVVNDYMDTKR